jgi:hypothetical protein
VNAVAVPAPRAPIRDRSTFGVLMLLPFGAVATAAAVIVGNGNPAIAVAPFVLLAGAYAVYTLPVRYPLLALIFVTLSVDATEEGPWSSPLAPIGTLLGANLNKTIPIGALALPGAALVMLGLVALLLHRRMIGSRLDSEGRGETASPTFISMAVSVAAVAMLCGLGAAKGGDMQMAKIQVQNFLQMLLVGYLVAVSLRDVRDYRTLGKLIVAAAILRSLYVLYVAHTLSTPTGEPLAVAATHGDSLLFAAAAVLLIIRFLEQPSSRGALWCAGVIPVLALAMLANNRRLVWAEVAAGLLVFAFVSRRSRMKRLLANAFLLSLPLIVMYVAAGWNSKSKIFAPVKTFRSMGDGQVDPSTLYRDLENYNLLLTMRFNQMTGAGFGQPFAETVTLPNISFFREYRYMPHNSVLGLWAFTGPFGFGGLFVSVMVAVYLAARSYKHARTADARTAAYMVIAMVAIYAAHCWGDIGFSERRTIFLVGPMLGIAGQLAVATGAWQPRQSVQAKQAA